MNSMTKLVEETPELEPGTMTMNEADIKLDDKAKTEVEANDCIELNLDEYFLHRNDRLLASEIVSNTGSAMACT